MKKTLNTATNETFTTNDGRTVRFEEILEGIRKNVDIYRFKGGRDMSDEDLEDIFQTAAMKAWRSISGFDPDKCHDCPQAYGSKIATLVERDAFEKANKLKERFAPLSAIKSKNKDGEEYDSLDTPSVKGRYHSNELDAERRSLSAENELVSRENVAHIWDAIDSLNPRYSNILRLTANGYKPREIAKMLGCEPEVVSLALCRARKALKRSLGSGFLSEYGLCA